MARPTDSSRILSFIDAVPGKKTSISEIGRYMKWDNQTTTIKVKAGVAQGHLFVNANGQVTRKRKSASPDKGKVQSRRATTMKARAPHGGHVSTLSREQLELPLSPSYADVVREESIGFDSTESANG